MSTVSGNNNNKERKACGQKDKEKDKETSARKSDGRGGASGTTKFTAESKREEFRRYLEKAGVLDALTRVLVGLYEEPEKPANAIEYLLGRLNTGMPLKFELESVQSEITDLERKIAEIERENSRLRRVIAQYENSNEEESGDAR